MGACTSDGVNLIAENAWKAVSFLLLISLAVCDFWHANPVSDSYQSRWTLELRWGNHQTTNRWEYDLERAETSNAVTVLLVKCCTSSADLDTSSIWSIPGSCVGASAFYSCIWYTVWPWREEVGTAYIASSCFIVESHTISVNTNTLTSVAVKSYRADDFLHASIVEKNIPGVTCAT